MEKETLTFSSKVKTELQQQGRTQVWLSKQMKLTTQTINNKFKNDSFNESEKFHIKSLLNF